MKMRAQIDSGEKSKRVKEPLMTERTGRDEVEEDSDYEIKGTQKGPMDVGPEGFQCQKDLDLTR